jgi:hypothetical protein
VSRKKNKHLVGSRSSIKDQRRIRRAVRLLVAFHEPIITFKSPQFAWEYPRPIYDRNSDFLDSMRYAIELMPKNPIEIIDARQQFAKPWKEINL